MTRKLVSLFLVLAMLFTTALAEEAANPLPLVTEPVELWFVGVHTGTLAEDFTNVPAIDRWEQETGITIRWDTYTQEAWAQQKQLLFTSNELPDALAGGAPISDGDLTQWTADELLMPLKDLSEKYMPRFQQIMEQHPEYYKSFIDETGEFYAFPTHFDIDFGSRGDVLMMSRAVLDQVGDWTYTDHEYFSTLDKAFTTDEFYQLLKDIKEKTGAIPLSVNGVYSLSFIFQAFGVHENWALDYVDNGEIKCFIEDENFVEAFDYVHKLYAEGLIDQEIATQSYDAWRSKLMTEGAVGVTSMWSGLIAVDDFTNMDDPRYSDWVGVVPLIGPDGTQQYCKASAGVAIKGGCAILSTTSPEKAELVCKFMDYLYSSDNSYQLSYGDYGVGLFKEDDGTLTQVFNQGEFLNTMFITTSEMNSKINYAPATAMAIEVGALLAKPFHAAWSFPTMITPEEYSSDLAELQSELSAYWYRIRSELVLEGGAAERLDEIKNELNKIGLEDYLEIRQDMLDIYNSL